MRKRVFASLVISGFLLGLFFCLLWNSRKVLAQEGSFFVVDESEITDKIEGAWVGQMAGVTWGAPTEFRYQGRIIPENEVPNWRPELVNDAFDQDDLYVEIPFLKALDSKGVTAPWEVLGDYFRDTTFLLFAANLEARNALKWGIKAPDSGHYTRNIYSDAIDWQIESDFAGIISPGMINPAIEIAWRGGHVMNFGDGVYGGVFIAAMHAKSFVAADVNEIVEAGRLSLPLGSKYKEIVEDVIAWKNQGKSWEENWRMLQNKWASTDREPDGKQTAFNIDAKLNGAYVLLGLLYGNGDFEQSIKLAMRAGQDSDCNASSVGGILGNWLGLRKIPEKWKTNLRRNGTNFSGSNLTFDNAVNISYKLAKEVLALSGGYISGTKWYILRTTQIKPPILEQWPLEENNTPGLNVSNIISPEGKVTFSASAFDSDGTVSDYQWFFGDLSYEKGARVTHTYTRKGIYNVIGYVTDNVGNTKWKSMRIDLNQFPTAVPTPSVTPSPTPTLFLTQTPTPTPTLYPTATNTPTALPTPFCVLKPDGDASCDGKVNLADFFIWRREFLNQAGSKNADFDNDGRVNLGDFFIWRRGFLKS